jgi:very-short-patch-repair endonuclease
MKEEIILSASELRKNQTLAENILWEKLRNRRFLAKKFVRQHPIKFEMESKERVFIADFFCFEKKLIIEVDGGIHSRQKGYDQDRDLIIQQLGLQVVRVTNKMIIEDIECFLANILTPLLFAREGAGG